MIQINRHNYEEYLMDYLDGSLTPQDNAIVMLFLKKNPDIRDEVEGLSEVHVGESDAVFNYKTELKRSTILNDSHATYFEELCIADIEGDLNEEEHEELVKLLHESPSKHKEYHLFEKTKVSIDDQVVFPYKLHLKQPESKFLSGTKLLMLLSAAASVLILLAVYIFLPQNESLNSDHIATESSHIVNDNTPKRKKIISNTEDIEKIKSITSTLVEHKNILTELKVIEKIETSELKNLRQKPINKMNSLDISYKKNIAVTQPHLADVSITLIKIEKQNDGYHGIRGFLYSVINRNVFNKKEEENLKFFHIAQAGVKGINKLVGGEMSLERTFDEKGVPKATEFSSNLVAFSKPVKKK